MLLLNQPIAALIWAGSVLAVPTTGSDNQTPTVTVKNGTYAGVHSVEYNQDFFLGVPFAQPPVGNFRFRAPQSLNSSWKGTKHAKTYSSACVGYGSDEIPYPALSEDCLYLNVIRPSGYHGQKLPVALWIHGGGLSQGSGIDQRYNLSFIVNRSVKIGKPIMGVSINYRLNMWGFITGNEVIKTGNANLGFRDQRLALHWVQENIRAFGGDPSKVTIWGESAGALSVGMHLTAYGGRNDRLFRGGIMQSGNPVSYGSLGRWDKYAFSNATNALGCGSASDRLQCLREVPYETLNTYINTTALNKWQPIVDGDFIKGYTSEQLAKGEFVHVPIISGANSDEGVGFGPQGINSTEDFLRVLKNILPAASATAVVSAYPETITYGAVPTSMPPSFIYPPPFGDHFRRSAAYHGDYSMIAHRRLACETWASRGVDAFCYRFNTIPNGTPYFIGTVHFQEVAFVFNNKNGVGYPPVSVNPFENMPPTYYSLSDKMSEAWVRFVHDGAPGHYWPRYKVKEPQNYVFDANVTRLGYAEPDRWRKAGIDLINSWNRDIYLR